MESIYLSDIENINISSLDVFDKREYLKQLKDYIIEYRTNLSLPSNVLYGVEIEYKGVDKSNLDEIIYEYPSFSSVEERNIEVGGELVSIPLKDDYKNWYDMKEILDILNSFEGIEKDTGTGSHVHVSANTLGTYDNFLKFLLLYSIYEGVIYRFGYMNRCNPRETMISCAVPSSIELSQDYHDFLEGLSCREIRKKYDRFHGINLTNLKSLDKYKEKNTIEFRMANGTFDPVLWQNIINFYTKFLLATHKDLDVERLEYLMYRYNINRMNYQGFDKYDLDLAIEFADIVFDNILDKTNFLKQYIKDGTETQNEFNVHMCKKFTRS